MEQVEVTDEVNINESNLTVKATFTELWLESVGFDAVTVPPPPDIYEDKNQNIEGFWDNRVKF